ncbi:hypothetical protein QT17_12845 [Thermus sp. 2.9]|uniref:PepSY domain-containing protein n=1 Tax=unclassified Thermus TaxID=2619321 RepID=UPI0005437BD6|nr:PepSY domain-containing protein [Thermus sp. 2.9]KHG64360.1 hypothetical protein QT17_12845 [Thermus sp. 2.9]
MRKAFLLGMLVWGLALAQGLPRVGFMEAVRAAQAWSRIPTPAEEISLSWCQGQPRYAVDLAKGRRLLQVYVDGMTGRVLGAKPLRERALGARAWLREPPGAPLGRW